MKSSENSVFDPTCNHAHSAKPLQLDVDEVLRGKLPRHYRYIPTCVVNWLRRTICQDRLNELLRLYGHMQGADFAAAILKHLNITVEVEGLENIPADTRKLIFACNHPLGALDGIALIALLGDRYRDRFRFIVNDMLMVIPPLADIFLPVNKHGAQSRRAAEAIAETMQGDYAIATFPAGLCSRNTHGSVIEDLKWQKAFVVKARQYNRTVVPMHFEGRNSAFFYRLAKWRKRLGVKFNIEMLYLPQEIFRSEGARFRVTFGKPIPSSEFTHGTAPDVWAAKVREICYSLR